MPAVSPQPGFCASGWRQGLRGCERGPSRTESVQGCLGEVQGLVTMHQSRSAGKKKRIDVSTEDMLSGHFGSLGPEPRPWPMLEMRAECKAPAVRAGGPQGRGGIRGRVSAAGSWSPAGRSSGGGAHRPSVGEFGVQGGCVCVPAPPACCPPSEGASVDLHLLLRDKSPPLLWPEGPSLCVQLSQAVVRPSAASWAASTTTVTGLGWRVRPGWGLCIPNPASL